MQTNIIWTGKLYHSMENCLLTKTVDGNEITSTIIGAHENQIYKVEYHIRTNKNWETTFVNLKTQSGNSNELFILEKKERSWLLNNKPNDGLKDIFDIDISLTPFTNTLPINRLQQKENERQTIEVIYFDILEKEIKPVKQIYTRLSIDRYTYENYDKSFKADIKIDDQGLVVDYPELFKMTAKRESHYG
ncbi:MAG TPA: putative glycolipid-binding domain-containing protein [Chryseolinea sp.]|nr:putative glycolipid-binding domain-containing protein [Chryseolinea sp.]